MQSPIESGAEVGGDCAETPGTPETRSTSHQTHPERHDPASPATLTLPSAQNAYNSPEVPGAVTLAQAKRLSHWSTRHQGLIKRCWGRKASPREAIKAQCLDCMGEDCLGIAECGDKFCPLWWHRPYQKSGATSAKP